MTDLAQRYAPGGDIYAANATAYGQEGAVRIWQAFLGGGKAAVPPVVAELKHGKATGSTSTLVEFGKLITTDPLGAPLESANRQLGLVVWNVFKNPFVLLAVVLAVFFWMGGAALLKGRLAK